MAKIQRQTQKIFAGNANVNEKAVFGSMKTGTPIYSNDIETLQSSDYEQGWRNSVAAGYAPFLEEMNGVLYGLSQQIKYGFQEGIAEYDADTTYYIGSMIKALNEENKPVLYTSLTDNNLGNPLTDATNWEELQLGSGAGLITGQLITSSIPLVEDTLHKPDGTLLQGDGIYASFVTYMANAYNTMSTTDQAICFCTESEWQTEVANNGYCRKYVYDSTANTLRLPLINPRVLMEDLGEIPAYGNGTSVGFTDGTNGCAIFAYGASGAVGHVMAGKDLYGTPTGTTYAANVLNTNKALGLSSDPTKSGIVASLENVKIDSSLYYYIVVGTTSKTDVEVNLDNIATDLNNKADKDLSNCTSSTFVDGGFVSTGEILVAHNISVTTTPQTFDISNIIPNDGYSYMINCQIQGMGSGVALRATSSQNYVAIRGVNTSVQSMVAGLILFVGPVERTISLSTASGTATNCTFAIFGYRRLGRNA